VVRILEALEDGPESELVEADGCRHIGLKLSMSSLVLIWGRMKHVSMGDVYRGEVADLIASRGLMRFQPLPIAGPLAPPSPLDLDKNAT
jgi:hypothetical protein